MEPCCCAASTRCRAVPLLATFGVVLACRTGTQDLGPLDPGPACTGAARRVGYTRPSLSLLRAVPDRHGAAGAGRLMAADAKRASACWCERRRRTADGGRAGRHQALLFTGAVPRRRWPRLRGALQTPGSPPTAYGHLRHRRAFVVTVVGGMGSVPGAFLAALLIAELQAFGILIFQRSRWCWCSC